MPKMIFINLPVADLDKSIAFYSALGAEQNHQFSDETAAGMVISDVIHVMLLTHEKFAQFTSRAIPDARKSAQMGLCLSCDSREEVDAQVAKAAGAGGKADPNAPQDFGFMYSRSYEDPDGHIWDMMYMDMAAMPTEAPAEASG